MSQEQIEQNLHRENLTLAPIKKRAVAAFIDELLLSFLLLLSINESFSSAANVEEAIALTNHYIVEYLAIKLIYQAFFIHQYGATLGKIAMKIRVVDSVSFAKPNILVSLNRSAVRIVSEMIFYIGYLWGAMDPLRQSWHDKSAKTLVINA
ncbi:MAG: RDD family protein [Sulfurimonas sp.]|nr:RDD family protein [Sulfurimonadaceae bacterium]